MRLFVVIALALLALTHAQNSTTPAPIITGAIDSTNDCWDPSKNCTSISCNEDQSNNCVEIALCDMAVIPGGGCYCPEGLIGTGCAAGSTLDCGGASRLGCSSEGWAVRVTFDVTDADPSLTADYNNKIVGITLAQKKNWASKLFGMTVTDYWYISSIHHSLSEITVWEEGAPVTKQHLSINMLHPSYSQGDANIMAQVFSSKKADADSNSNYATQMGQYVFGAPLLWKAKVYRWKAQTTSAPIGVQATGMTVDSMQFLPACKDSGCWVIDVTYTSGDATGNFNTFYLPRVQDDDGKSWQEDLSFDRVHKGIVAKSFLPKEFPCGSNVVKGGSSQWDYDNMVEIQGKGQTPDDGFTTTCCIPNFLQHYRAIQGFQDYFNTTHPACQNDMADVIDRPKWAEKFPWDNATLVPFPAAQPFLTGNFSDINAHVEYLAPLDPYIGQHSARFFIDEVELRRKAGKLAGTVGVQYTVDTFLGFANFRPTGTYVLDIAAMQVKLHLEKTNFFSVSTEGTNAYTFLEYVNMRLVTIYDEDVQFGGETEDGAADKNFGTNFYRTSSEGSADYVQVTFTMGEQYTPNLNGQPWSGGLIPLSSVRAGKSTFFNDDFMEHKCVQYLADPGAFDGNQNNLNSGGNAPAPPPPPPSPASSERRSGATRDTRNRVPSLRRAGDAEAEATGTTWGPLNSCHEQSRCIHMEFNEVTEGQKCATGDGECEWEVCMVFSAADASCRVYEECPEIFCAEAAHPYEFCDDQTRCYGKEEQVTSTRNGERHYFNDGNGLFRCVGQLDIRSVWGTNYTTEEWTAAAGAWCGFPMAVLQGTVNSFYGPYQSPPGPGDNNEESYFGNLIMWCDETNTDCPADLQYPKDNVEYFVKNGGKANITKNDYNCQRGKKGQKLYFVMRDGDNCAKNDAYIVEDMQKAQWAAISNKAWPEGATAVCEPRDNQQNECSACVGDAEKGTNADNTEWDGTNPCGCMFTTNDDESGFDTCTETFGLREGSSSTVKNDAAECVWAVVLPDFCSPPPPENCTCPNGDKKVDCGECTPACVVDCNCPKRNNPLSLSPEFECCGTFNQRLCQDCASRANMCVSPQDTPDHFVSFNIPLGVDWYPLNWGEGPETLDDNVFVHMVINALDITGCRDPGPNSGCDPLQVKTTLFGSIPVVQGGLNIFCDGVRAKTDLMDVSNADYVVGTANSLDELSRLRILENVATTSLNKLAPDATRVINSDSIEAAFLTLIVKGNSSYFELPGTRRYALELEDLITVHIMEPLNVASDRVQSLVELAPDDNYDITAGEDNPVLQLAGYKLNGAFRFTIDREENRASLEPTAELLAVCPFNPPRPAISNPFPTTCVTRRDVRHRGFPNRAGALSTAMEVVPLWDVAAGTCANDIQTPHQDGYTARSADPYNLLLPACNSGCTLHQNSLFMQSVLGANDYAYNLGRSYSCVIAKKYKLDSRYNRAWWINPNYEWTATQTGGQPIFTISQKIFLFALINLNEQWGATSTSVNLPLPNQPVLSRRRLLSNTANTGSGVGASLMEFDVSPSKMLAGAFDVPEDKVATWKVVLALSEEQACIDPTTLQPQIRALMKTYALDTASRWEELLITSMEVDKDGVQCPASGRRTIARRLLNNPSVTMEMMIVFAKGTNAFFDMEKFSKIDGIMSLEGVGVSPKVFNVEVPDEAKGTPEPEESSSSSNIGLIAGCAAGGAVLLLGGGFMLWRMNRQTTEAEVVTALPNLATLKSQLHGENQIQSA